MQFVAGVRKLGEADDRRVARRSRVGVDDRDRVGLVGGLGEGRYVGQFLRRASGGIARGPVEGRIVIVGMAIMLSLIVGRHGGPLS